MTSATTWHDAESKHCAVEFCEGEVVARGWCNLHYKRWWKYGDPLATPRSSRPRPIDFVLAVFSGSAPVESNGCILWPHARNEGGYGVVKVDGVQRVATRVVLEYFVGPPPTDAHTAGHAPHEVCGDRRCIAPEHLSWQTPAEQAATRDADGTTISKCARPAAPPELKADAVRRVLGGETVTAVSRSTGYGRRTVSGWVRQHRDAEQSSNGSHA